MAYLTESDVRKAARSDRRVILKSMDSSAVLREAVGAASVTDQFDVFLCHSVRDAEIVQGAKTILEQNGLKVYVDWIVDPQMDRSAITAATADLLRQRMKKSKSLLYLFSNNSKRSRWMPWEIGYFDGYNGTVGVLPVTTDNGDIDFSQEEYLGLYPKVELQQAGLLVNRTVGRPVPKFDSQNWKTFGTWLSGYEKLKL